MATRFIEEDFVVVREAPNSKSKRLITLAFGDQIELVEEGDEWSTVRVHGQFKGPFEGYVKGKPLLRDEGVLKLSMLDVQQGDGLILETPAGKIVFIDGGDNKLFARHAAARYRHRQTSRDEPLEVDAIIVTHGDADHFDGLNDIRRSEELTGYREHKRLFIRPKRIFHNGLVKGPSTSSDGKRISDTERFGRTVADGDDLLIVDLYDDPRTASEDALNRNFKWWRDTINHWDTGTTPIQLTRVAHGMDETQLFDFLFDEGIGVEIQGPFQTEVDGPDTNTKVPALPFFHKPKRSAEVHLEQGGNNTSPPSASHTINGHSIALRLTYENVRINLTGDLNQEAMDHMLGVIGAEQLEAEIVKAPHHGSHDFDYDALEAMKPIVACVSSGDESAAKEYIHPRATLMAALGMVMRRKTGIVLNTELAAFFKTRGYSYTRDDLAKYFKDKKHQAFTGEQLCQLFSGVLKPGEDPDGAYFAFERSNFGIINVRTDGERVLVFTHSGREGLNEAYRFYVTMVGGERKVEFAPEVKTR